MYSIEVDTHVHSIICEHAYSTIEENAKYAKKVGIKAIAITDHGPRISPFDNTMHFYNLKVLPKELHGVRIYTGAEVNILEKDYKLDLEDKYLKKLDWNLASFHKAWDEDLSYEYVTEAYINALKNPYIDCVAHMGQPKFICDYKAVIDEAKKQGKVIEINNNSPKVRIGCEKNCVEIAKLCKEKGVYVSVCSDAHISTMIGDYSTSFDILKETDFPCELIVNRTVDAFENYLKMKKRRLQWIDYLN